jgi:rhomboid protease GluP
LLFKAIPADFSKVLLVVAVIFICYNLVIGLAGGIDNAAHIGGLISGFIAGIVISTSLKKEYDLEVKKEQYSNA